MKRLLCFLIVIINLMTSLSAQTEPNLSTNGEYILETKEHLLWLTDQVNSGTDFSGKNFILNNDITLPSDNWSPIGTSGKPFKGNLDGKGFSIKNLTITSINNEGYAGFFGYIEGGLIRNLGIEINSINISAGPKDDMFVGGMAGFSNSVIVNCRVYAKYIFNGTTKITATSTNNGKNLYVGGIAGSAQAAIYNSFINCIYFSRTSKKGAGGCIAGITNTEIKHCVIATVSAITDCNWIAGSANTTYLAENYRDEDCYSPINNPASVQGGKLNGTFYEFLNASLANYASYGPLYKWTGDGNMDTSSEPVIETAVFEGKGSKDSPYKIKDADDLMILAQKVNEASAMYIGAYYLLANDIDMSGNNWIPIGTSSHPFKGTFDGNHQEIKNLKMESNKTYAYGGLFGYTTNATIKNTILNNIDISYTSFGGGIVGSANENSKLYNNLVYGDIKITYTSNGNNKNSRYRIAGSITNSTLENNYATGSEIGNSAGLTGRDGLTLLNPSITTSTTLTSGDYLLTGTTTVDIDASACTGKTIYCLHNEVGNIKLAASAKMLGWIKTGSIELSSKTDITELEIDNSGEIIFNYVPEIYDIKGQQGGWTTICLPFDANSYVGETKVNPVTIGKGGGYWLRQFVAPPTDGNSETLYFASYESTNMPEHVIQKNTPYIISIPGSTYDNNSSLEGKIAFKGYGPINFDVANPNIQYDNSNYIFEGRPKGLNSATGYLLNDAGVNFVSSENTSIAPYQAYFLPKGTSASNAQVLRIATGTNQPTDLTDGIAEEKNIRAYVADGVLYLTCENQERVKIWNAGSGMMVREVEVNNETTIVTGLQKGIYIINHEKVVVY